jgi:uncharacterized protein (DUF302 family)/glutaredoxin
MLKLYQREECPSCRKVRQYLAHHDLAFEAVNVPRLGSERQRMDGFPNVEKPEVPILRDGDKTVQGSDSIVEHLKATRGGDAFGDPSYGLTRTLPGLSFGDALGAVKAALATEGFGVLTEIDVKATLKKKIGEDFRNYVILGACNPRLAHQALSGEPALGLLLPCNVVVTEDGNSNAVVSAIDPRQMFKVVGNEQVEPIAKEVREKLSRALTALTDKTD